MDGDYLDEGSAPRGRAEHPAGASVCTVVREIDERTREEEDTLLSELLSTAWPTPISQAQ